jgi:hypothetical protein
MINNSPDYENLRSRLRKSIIQRDHDNCLNLIEKGKTKLTPGEFERCFIGEVNKLGEIDRQWFKNRFSIVAINGNLDYA